MTQVSIPKTLDNLANNLKAKIFGQAHVIEAVADLLTVSFAGLGDPTRPLGSFLFTGPTGVGKTELARELAKLLDMELIRFDMSEYSDDYAARNLTGGHKGLVGYEDGGLLTNAVMEHPSSVVLLDEIEKAHPSIYNAFLQVLDYATLTDTKGNKADFRQCVIIMTSNLGATESRGIGFGNTTLYRESAVAEFLTPEFRNRIDRMLEFRPLSREMIGGVVDKFLSEFAELLEERYGVILDATPAAREMLADIGYESAMGARAIRRAIDREFKQVLAREVLYGRLKNGGYTQIDAGEEGFVFRFAALKSGRGRKAVRNTEKECEEVLPKEYRKMREKILRGETGNEPFFLTAEEAQAYARAHPGVWIRRREGGEGFEVLER